MKRITGIALSLILLLLPLTACSFGTDDSAEATVDAFLAAIVADDIVEAKTYVSDPDKLESMTTVAKNLGLEDDKLTRLSGHFTDIVYTIGSTSKTEDGQGAYVVITLTIPDYAPIFKQSLADHQGIEDTNEALLAVVTDLADGNPDKVKKSVAVYLVKSGESWVIDSNNNLELLNCIYGNLQSALQEHMTI